PSPPGTTTGRSSATSSSGRCPRSGAARRTRSSGAPTAPTTRPRPAAAAVPAGCTKSRMSGVLDTAGAARAHGADERLHATSALPLAIPLASGLLAAGVFAWTLLERAAALKLPAYDTAFFEQLVWNAGRGRGFTSGFFAASGITSPANFLGLHFSPLLALPAA